jgi:hypothetical protein
MSLARQLVNHGLLISVLFWTICSPPPLASELRTTGTFSICTPPPVADFLLRIQLSNSLMLVLRKT